MRLPPRAAPRLMRSASIPATLEGDGDRDPAHRPRGGPTQPERGTGDDAQLILEEADPGHHAEQVAGAALGVLLGQTLEILREILDARMQHRRDLVLSAGRHHHVDAVAPLAKDVIAPR